MKKITILILAVLCSVWVRAQYITPGTGVNWTLQEFVDNSAGIISYDNGIYYINGTITISADDTVNISVEAFFRIADGYLITVNGVLMTGTTGSPVTFTPMDEESYYTGFKFQDSPGSSIKHTTFSRAGGIKLLNSTIEFVGCDFSYFNQANCTGTLDISQSAPVISQCVFLENAGPAVMSAANGNASPQILNCQMQGNVTSNANMPQINLGAAGADSVRIIGNEILGNTALIQVGGIAIATLAGGSIKARIEGNTINNNRYGMTQFGNNIASVIKNNIITNNNTQGLPDLGGSGINFYGNTTNVSLLSGNIISGNLWGITIQNNALPNLGQLEGEELNDGMNQLFSNGNNNQVYDLYNNTPGEIWAQNNYWGTMNPDTVEQHIFHQPDDPSLGVVHFLPLFDPTVTVRDLKPRHEMHILAYPNPARDLVTINGLPVNTRAAVRLLSTGGAILAERIINADHPVLDVSSFGKGIFILEITVESKIFTRLLVVE
ncbi:MAG TPA: T9SS type A sorting domain-containing protein [Bacteroidales bacterium]|nr:T9SS type A sorting domain-containing protein [Bacteroidales bacterium]